MHIGALCSPVHIGERIRHFRTLKGISQDALAACAGMSRRQIVKIEGRANTTTDTLLSVLKILEVKPAEFFSTGAPPGVPEEHEDFHFMLETILNGPEKWADGIKANVESLYESSMKETGEKAKAEIEASRPKKSA